MKITTVCILVDGYTAIHEWDLFATTAMPVPVRRVAETAARITRKVLRMDFARTVSSDLTKSEGVVYESDKETSDGKAHHARYTVGTHKVIIYKTHEAPTVRYAAVTLSNGDGQASYVQLRVDIPNSG